MAPRIVYRADAAAGIGIGHIVRGLALAEATVSTGAEWAFACRPGSAAAAPILATSGRRIIELPMSVPKQAEYLRRAMPEGCDLLVVDHYGLGRGFEVACRGWAGRILAMEDIPERAHDCDLLLDPTVGRTAAEYDDWVPPRCAAITGADYALLRPEFAQARPGALARRATCGKNGAAGRILVALGGTDPDNRTAMAMAGTAKALAGTKFEVDVVLPSRAPHFAAVLKLVEGFGASFRLHSDQNARAMAALMSRADMAIGAGGATAWERCVLGLPSILLTIADNQRDVARALAERGAAILANHRDDVSLEAICAAVLALANDPERRAGMARSAAQICDGRGAMRVALLLAGWRSRDGTSVKLRPFARGDRDALFAWQQIPGLRRLFKNPDPPTVAEHAAWFAAARADPRVRHFMITAAGQRAGTLRLNETEEGVFVVSILVAPEYSRRGLAAAALDLAHVMWPGVRFLAKIHPDNAPSLALFASAGYAMAQPGLHAREPEAGVPSPVNL